MCAFCRRICFSAIDAGDVRRVHGASDERGSAALRTLPPDARARADAAVLAGVRKIAADGLCPSCSTCSKRCYASVDLPLYARMMEVEMQRYALSVTPE